MKLTLFLGTILLMLTLSTPASITENFTQSLYIQLNPIFENTFQQLKDLVNDLAKKISQFTRTRVTRSDPSDWFDQLFEGSGSITNQWNSEINEFFQNIPTIYENGDRSLLSNTFVASQFHPAVKSLVQKLKKLVDNKIDRVILPTIKQQSKSHTDKIFQEFQGQVTRLFEKTEERLNQTIDNLFQSISNYFNQLKDRFLG